MDVAAAGGHDNIPDVQDRYVGRAAAEADANVVASWRPIASWVSRSPRTQPPPWHLHAPREDQSSTVLVGRRLGITEVDGAISLVSFMHYDLGYIDLEQRALQTIDNPFGTRLSPMY